MRALPVVAATALFLTGAAGAAPDTVLRLTAQQISTIQGKYKLRDGRQAHIVGVDQRIYIRIGRGPQKELLMIGPGQFASTSGEVLIVLRPERNDKRVVLGYARGIEPDTSIRIAANAPPGRGSAD